MKKKGGGGGMRRRRKKKKEKKRGGGGGGGGAGKGGKKCYNPSLKQFVATVMSSHSFTRQESHPQCVPEGNAKPYGFCGH